jgi:hypothetical protein
LTLNCTTCVRTYNTVVLRVQSSWSHHWTTLCTPRPPISGYPDILPLRWLSFLCFCCFVSEERIAFRSSPFDAVLYMLSQCKGVLSIVRKHRSWADSILSFAACRPGWDCYRTKNPSLQRVWLSSMGLHLYKAIAASLDLLQLVRAHLIKSASFKRPGSATEKIVVFIIIHHHAQRRVLIWSQPPPLFVRCTRDCPPKQNIFPGFEVTFRKYRFRRCSTQTVVPQLAARILISSTRLYTKIKQCEHQTKK